MPLLDLTDVDAVRYNGKDVSEIRLNEETLWVSPSPPAIEHSVFGSGPPPVSMSSHDDVSWNEWVVNQFFVDGVSAELSAVKIFVPSGSGMIGQSGTLSVVNRSVANGGLLLGTDYAIDLWDTSVANLVSIGPMVAGWNRVNLDEPMLFNSADAMIIGYYVNHWYLSDGLLLEGNHVKALDDFPLYLVQRNGGTFEPYRAFYGVYYIRPTSGGYYGIDPIVREVS